MPESITWRQDHQDRTRFDQQGFLIVKGRAIADFKATVAQHMLATSLKIAERFDEAKSHLAELARMPLGELVDWCGTHENDRRITRAFYEVWPATSEVISLVSHPLFAAVNRYVGIRTPVPGAIPVIRIDRPSEDRFATPPHQDYWYSMLSPNSVVIWMPLRPLEPSMGLLQVVPGSHKAALRPFRVNTDSTEPYALVETMPEAEWVSASVAEDELIVFSQHLVHRSSRNDSDKSRISLQLRYNDLDTQQAMTSSFIQTHSRWVKERQEEVLRGRP